MRIEWLKFLIFYSIPHIICQLNYQAVKQGGYFYVHIALPGNQRGKILPG